MYNKKTYKGQFTDVVDWKSGCKYGHPDCRNIPGMGRENKIIPIYRILHGVHETGDSLVIKDVTVEPVDVYK